jgi:DNA invertase Pin-like site-specific DNA recombinase
MYNARMGDRVIGYVRVSTEEQADSGAGLRAQRAAILAEAERRGWVLVDVIEDAGYSGKDLRRPGINAALDALKHHRADSLVVAKLDRLSRSMLDFAALMDKATKEHWGLVALDLGVDTSTPAGEAMANVLATFAQFERRLISQRTRDALQIKKSEGAQLGRKSTLPTSTIEMVDSLRSEGLSYRAIAERLNADQIPTGQGAAQWHASSVRAVLAAHRRRKDEAREAMAAILPLLQTPRRSEKRSGRH